MPSARPATAPPRRHSRAANRATAAANATARSRAGDSGAGCAGTGSAGSACWWSWAWSPALYVQQALAYLSVRSQADQQRAIVHQLARSNASLRAQQRSLSEPATILRDARALGMVRAGEHPYEVTGLPGR